EPAPKWYPAFWRAKLEGRRLPSIPREQVRRIRFPELLQRGLPMAGLMSLERGNWLNNHLFDAMALRWVGNSRVFHFVSSVGLRCAQLAKKRGALIVCDVRQEHPAFQRRILEEEASLFHTTAEVTGSTYEQKVLDELALADYIVVPSEHARRTY